MRIKSRLVSCLAISFVLLIGTFAIAFGQNEAKNPAVGPDRSQKGIEISILVDNYSCNEGLNNFCKEGLDPAWGLSCLVRGTEKTILFDTGPRNGPLPENMRKMNIKPEEVDVVVLSHIHHDHTGGLQRFLEENHDVIIYLPKSFPPDFKEGARASGAKVVEVTGPLKICALVYSTGELEGMEMEQSLVVRTDMGGIVIVGCSHPGIVEIVSMAKKVLKGDLVLAMGGFHLLSVFPGEGPSSQEIEKIVSDLKVHGVRYVGSTHCSGDEARGVFKNAYQKHYLDLGAGKVIMAKDLR